MSLYRLLALLAMLSLLAACVPGVSVAQPFQRGGDSMQNRECRAGGGHHGDAARPAAVDAGGVEAGPDKARRSADCLEAWLGRCSSFGSI